MNMESLRFLALLFAPFLIAFILEALVIYAFKMHQFWASAGISIIINLLTLAIIFYGVTAALGKLNYEFNGLNLPLPVVAFLWWFSSIADSFLLRLFSRKAPLNQVLLCSIVMNALSYAFLYIFIVNSH